VKLKPTFVGFITATSPPDHRAGQDEHTELKPERHPMSRPRKGVYKMNFLRKTVSVSVLLILASALALAASDRLPSWNEGASKKAIIEFVKAVTTKGSPYYVEPAERIATFDNDGTLMAEQPIYFQFLFEAVKFKDLGFDMKDNQSVKKAIDYLLASDPFGDLLVDPATGTSKTEEEFMAEVDSFLSNMMHPRFNRPFIDLVYQPMIELIDYLKLSGFKVYIVTATHSEFIRLWSEKAFGIQPEMVVGSSVKVKYELKNGKGILSYGKDVNFICNGPDKPAGINYSIGKRPIAAFGNSDGDIQMIEYATTGKGLRLGLLVHHTDAAREWAYDNPSDIGQLKDGLSEAAMRGWVVVDMKKDWKVIYPFEKKARAKKGHKTM
jgi:phosphoserine phosphatase